MLIKWDIIKEKRRELEKDARERQLRQICMSYWAKNVLALIQIKLVYFTYLEKKQKIEIEKKKLVIV